MTDSVPARPDRRDLVIAAVLAVASAVLYRLTAQGRIYGNDGSILADWYALPERAYTPYHNVLYLPVARLVGLVWPARDPLDPLLATCALAGAVGIGLAYLTARHFGPSRQACGFGAVLLAITPVQWFFGTVIEVHALHFATVSLCALTICAGPWDRRPLTAALLAAAVLPLTYLTHQSAPILGPGWVLLAQWARSRRAAPFRLLPLAGVGVLFLAGIVVGHVIGNVVRNGAGIDVGFVVDTVGFWRKPFGWQMVVDTVLEPFALLTLLTAAGLVVRGATGWERLTCWTFLAPCTAFFLWWGIPERGGYLLGYGFVYVLLAARVADRATAFRAGPWLLGVVLLAQAWLGATWVHQHDAAGEQIADRVRIVAAAHDGQCVLISANNNAPNIEIWLPEVREFNLLATFLDPSATPEQWLAVVLPVLDAMAAGRPFLLERSYRNRADFGGSIGDRLDALEAELQERYQVTAIDDPSWPLWSVAPRG